MKTTPFSELLYPAHHTWNLVAHGLAVAGVHFRAGIRVERPSLAAVAAELHAPNFGINVPAGRPADIRRNETNLTDRPRIIQSAAAPRFPAIRSAMDPTLDFP